MRLKTVIVIMRRVAGHDQDIRSLRGQIESIAFSQIAGMEASFILFLAAEEG